jgi:hypothetical protein
VIHNVHTHVAARWQADAFDVYVFDRVPEGSVGPDTIYRVNGDTWTLEPAGDRDISTGLPKPSFSLPRDVMEAMLKQSKRLVPGLDRDDAVADARAVRDRLLTLVEGVVEKKR